MFSNTVPPPVIAAALEAFDMLSTNTYLRDKLESNTLYFREEISKLGFDIIDGIHPIIPIMLYDAVLAKEIASRMLIEGIYVIGFNYPVVPKNQARIRIQISASMTKTHLDKALNAFKKVGLDMGIISK